MKKVIQRGEREENDGAKHKKIKPALNFLSYTKTNSNRSLKHKYYLCKK